MESSLLNEFVISFSRLYCADQIYIEFSNVKSFKENEKLIL